MVAHWHYLLSLAVIWLLMVAAWWVIGKLASDPVTGVRRWVLGLFLLGTLLQQAVMLDPGVSLSLENAATRIARENRFSLLGALLMLLTAVLTIAGLVWAGGRRLSGRR